MIALKACPRCGGALSQRYGLEPTCVTCGYADYKAENADPSLLVLAEGWNYINEPIKRTYRKPRTKPTSHIARDVAAERDGREYVTRQEFSDMLGGIGLSRAVHLALQHGVPYTTYRGARLFALDEAQALAKKVGDSIKFSDALRRLGATETFLKKNAKGIWRFGMVRRVPTAEVERLERKLTKQKKS